VPSHKFKIGQTVFLRPRLELNVRGGSYIIIERLPLRDGNFEYRVKSINESHERVVSESQMRLAGD
jgi:hypothetical protein